MLNFVETFKMALPPRWIYLLLLAFIWGSSFILIKLGLQNLTPFQLGAFRILCAGTFLLAIGFRTLPQIPRHKWKMVALTSLCGTFAPAFLFAMAQTQISSSVSSIMNSMTAIITLIVGAVMFKLNFRRNQVLGVVLGFAGALVLILSGAMHHPEQNYWYALLALTGSLCYGVNINLIKTHLSEFPPLAIVSANFAVMILPASAILGFSGFFSLEFNPAQLESAGYVALLGLFGTGVANIIFYRLIKSSTPVFAASVTYLIPVVAFLWGLLDGEQITLSQLIGASIVLAGVYLAGKKS